MENLIKLQKRSVKKVKVKVQEALDNNLEKVISTKSETVRYLQSQNKQMK